MLGTRCCAGVLPPTSTKCGAVCRLPHPCAAWAALNHSTQLLEQPSADLDIALSTLTGHTFALLLREYLASPEYRASPLAQQPELQHAAMGSIARIEANPEQSKNLETATVQLLGLSLDFVNLRKEVYEGESRIPSMVSGPSGLAASRRHGRSALPLRPCGQANKPV